VLSTGPRFLISRPLRNDGRKNFELQKYCFAHLNPPARDPLVHGTFNKCVAKTFDDRPTYVLASVLHSTIGFSYAIKTVPVRNVLFTGRVPFGILCKRNLTVRGQEQSEGGVLDVAGRIECDLF
jgi:hypothetical protein